MSNAKFLESEVQQNQLNRKRKAKIAYLTLRSPKDAIYWSGIPCTIDRVLRGSGYSLFQYTFDIRLLKFIFIPISVFWRIRNKVWLAERSPILLYFLRIWIMARLYYGNYDFIFSTTSILAAATPLPNVVFWTDAEFDSYVDAYYSAVERGALANFDDGARQEAAALTNCSMAIYASAWAARHVAARWPQFVDKLAVIPFGENLEKVPSRADVDAAIAAKDMSECRLLFIGVDWRRKGGDRAVEFHAALCEAGCPSRLTIIGPAVQPDLEGLPGVVQLGFLRKDDATDAEVIGRELHRAHFLILPSRAEALGIVLVEAAAYGTPAITTAVGGIPEIIDDGVNGIVDDFADPVALAVRIKKIMGCKNLYTSMAKRSRDEFDERLSWSARIEQFDQEIHSGKIV